MQGVRIRSLGLEDPLREMETHSRILAWEIGQRSLVGYSPGGCKVRHDLATKQRQQNLLYTFRHIIVSSDFSSLEIRKQFQGRMNVKLHTAHTEARLFWAGRETTSVTAIGMMFGWLCHGSLDVFGFLRVQTCALKGSMVGASPWSSRSLGIMLISAVLLRIPCQFWLTILVREGIHFRALSLASALWWSYSKPRHKCEVVQLLSI